MDRLVINNPDIIEKSIIHNEELNGEEVISNINIICTKDQNDVFALYCEFFKLCGLFVIKSIDRPYQEEDITFKPERVLDIRDKKYVWTNPKNRKIRSKDLIVFLLNAIKEVGLKERWNLEALAEIYLNNNLMRVNILDRFYYKDIEYAGQCISYLRNAVDSIEKNVLNIENNKVPFCAQFFCATCKLKINRFGKKIGGEEPYPTAVLMDEVLSIDSEKEYFVQKYILASMIAERHTRYQTMGKYYLSKAMVQKGPQKGYVEYRIGQYYEKIEENAIQALECYTCASRDLKRNYRALYKMANLHLKMGKEDAMKIFQEVVRLIGNDVNGDLKQLQPIQIEYIYKTYLQIFQSLQYKTDQNYILAVMKENEKQLREIIENNRYIYNILRTDPKSSKNFEQILQEEKEQLLEVILNEYENG